MGFLVRLVKPYRAASTFCFLPLLQDDITRPCYTDITQHLFYSIECGVKERIDGPRMESLI